MRTPPLLPLVLATAALASSYGPSAHAGGLPVCNGKHKRSANPYGSVLSDGLKPTLSAEAKTGAPAAGGKAEPAAVTPAAKPQKVSKADLLASFAPCGDRA